MKIDLDLFILKPNIYEARQIFFEVRFYNMIHQKDIVEILKVICKSSYSLDCIKVCCSLQCNFFLKIIYVNCAINFYTVRNQVTKCKFLKWIVADLDGAIEY